MANIVREDKDNLITHLTLTIEPQDYQQKFNSELAKYSQQANLKGFRKGKTPKSIIRKMHGKGILEEIVGGVFQKELQKYVEEELKNIVLQPLLAEGHQVPIFDPKHLDSYEYHIVVGRTPDFEIQGIQESDTYSRYKVESAPADLIDKELEGARKRVGERKTVEEDIQDNDLVKLRVRGAEGSGIDNDFSVLVGDTLTDEMNALLTSKKQGDTFEFVPANMEKNLDEDRVLYYLLGYTENDDDSEEKEEEDGFEEAEIVEEENESEVDEAVTETDGEEDNGEPDIHQPYQFEIEEVTRIELAEITEDFLKEQFGENVTTEEEAREMIEERLLEYYNDQANIMLQNDILERVTTENKPELPETFIKRFMSESQPDTSEEEIDSKLEEFKKGVIWELVSKRLMKDYEIEVAEEDIVRRAQQQIASYFGGQGDPQMMSNMTHRMLQDENFARQMYDSAATEKIAVKLAEVVHIEDDIKTIDEMDELFKAQQEKREQEEAERIAAQVEEAAAVKEVEETEEATAGELVEAESDAEATE